MLIQFHARLFLHRSWDLEYPPGCRARQCRPTKEVSPGEPRPYLEVRFVRLADVSEWRGWGEYG